MAEKQIEEKFIEEAAENGHMKWNEMHEIDLKITHIEKERSRLRNTYRDR